MQKKGVLRNIVLFLFIHSTFWLEAQVDFRCVSVENNDSVRLSWIKLAPDEFESYMVYYSPQYYGSYTLLTTLNTIEDTIYKHYNPLTSQQRVYYYIKNGSSTITSDTLNNIFIHTFNNINHRIANLAWYPSTDNTPSYNIQKMINNSGAWDNISQSILNEYNDSVLFCDTVFLKYRVYYQDNSGCFSYSDSTEGKKFSPTLSRPPVNDTVSVINDGNSIIITWEPNILGYIKGYYIVKYINQTDFNIIHYVDGKNTSFYIDTLQQYDPNSSAYAFGVISADTCGGINDASGPMSTIFLQTSKIDICKKHAIINWNAYTFYQTQLKGYYVYVYEDGNLRNKQFTESLGDTIENLQDEKNYRILVQAVNIDESKTSSSNHQEFTFNYPTLPEQTRFLLPSVNEDNEVMLTIETESNIFYWSAEILKSLDSLNFDSLGTLEISNSDMKQFMDAETEFESQSVYYKVKIIDSCLNYTDFEDIGNTIHLQVSVNGREHNVLEWNDNSKSDMVINSYRLHRIIDGTPNPQQAIPLEKSTLNFNDPLFEYEDYDEFRKGEGSFNYQIEANVESTAGNITYSIFSNKVNLEQLADMYIPNAYAPGSTDEEFKPIHVFVKEEGYEFLIYNKWGNCIFESKDKDKGWDGRYNGEELPQGVYVYYIKYLNEQGITKQKKGTITLLK